MNIDLNESKLKRGDSYEIFIDLAPDTGTFNVGDVIEFALRKKVEDLNYALVKSTADGGITVISPTQAKVNLLPNELRNLKGVYYWEVQRKSSDGLMVDTLIIPSGETLGTLEIEADLIRP